ncbi:hypothetical protein [Paenibacillus taiwanensis]|uniref:hypothetical protein n=1 Tax=Paenibacillus taiwanensis TaxID=401638 RepID=UPI0003FFD590|nr:hypothetical protein [Paenibacillus taiwanensis]
MKAFERGRASWCITGSSVNKGGYRYGNQANDDVTRIGVNLYVGDIVWLDCFCWQE